MKENIPVVIFEDDEQSIPIKVHPHNEHKSNGEVFVLKPEEEAELPIKPLIQPSDYAFWLTHPTKYFLKENLFSELTNDYQRRLARENLGIPTTIEFRWGNLTGNLLELTDLANFITNLLNLIKIELGVDLSKKANINSPAFTGTPTSVTPIESSNDKSIATTEWVMTKIAALGGGTGIGGGNPIVMNLYPATALINTVNNVKVVWSYSGLEVTKQVLNGNQLSTSVKEYTFTRVDKNTTYTLEVETNEGTYTRLATFTLKYPTLLYGTSIDYSLLSATLDSTVECNANANEFIYIGTTLTDPKFSVNGFIGGFMPVGTYNYSGLKYNIYRTTYSGLGLTKVTVSE